jgi:hypothetical protein
MNIYGKWQIWKKKSKFHCFESEIIWQTQICTKWYQLKLSNLYLAKVIVIPEFFKSFWQVLFKKIPKFQNFSMRSYRELQYAQNDTKCSSQAWFKPKLWSFLTFFKSFWEMLFKEFQNFKILSMRSYGKLQYAQNDTDCSTLACI